MPPIEVIINAAGGSFVEEETERTVRNAFTRHGLEINLHLARSGEEIAKLAESAVNSEATIIAAGGGDGTISSVASVVAGSDKTFAVLPLGTLNNFSKDLGIPQDIDEAIAVIAAGKTNVIDLAEVNGRIFLNNSSIGLYPQIVRNREQQQRLGYGKWRAAFWSALRAFRIARFLRVGINLEGKFFLRKTPFVFVGNNRYEMDSFNIGRRASLMDGRLCVYFLHRGGRIGVIALLLRMATGTARQWREFEEVLTDMVTIQTRRKRLPVAFDGEVATMDTPLKYRIIPEALRVLVPPPEPDEGESDA
jgi:YegS/Rv2252/BmrU family lipid kinase